jgi:lysophospholipase L1-like esterase
LYRQKQPNAPISTLNFAISGQGAVQHVADLPGLAQIYRPQVVVAQLSVYDFWPQDALRKIPTQPAYLSETDGNLAVTLQPVARASGWRSWLMQNRLFSFYARVSWRLQSLLYQQAETETQLPPDQMAGSIDADYFARYTKVTRFLLARFAAEAKNANAQGAVLYTPQTPLLNEGRVFLEEDEIGRQYAQERAILREACRELNLPFWDPTARFVSYVTETGQFPKGFANNRPGYGHLNPEGHRIVAGLVADELHKLLSPRN